MTTGNIVLRYTVSRHHLLTHARAWTRFFKPDVTSADWNAALMAMLACPLNRSHAISKVSAVAWIQTASSPDPCCFFWLTIRPDCLSLLRLNDTEAVWEARLPILEVLQPLARFQAGTPPVSGVHLNGHAHPCAHALAICSLLTIDKIADAIALGLQPEAHPLTPADTRMIEAIYRLPRHEYVNALVQHAQCWSIFRPAMHTQWRDIIHSLLIAQPSFEQVHELSAESATVVISGRMDAVEWRLKNRLTITVRPERESYRRSPTPTPPRVVITATASPVLLLPTLAWRTATCAYADETSIILAGLSMPNALALAICSLWSANHDYEAAMLFDRHAEAAP